MLPIPPRMPLSERECFAQKLFDGRLRIALTTKFGDEQFEVLWDAEDTPLRKGEASGFPPAVAVVAGTPVRTLLLQDAHRPYSSGLPQCSSVFRMMSSSHAKFPVGAMNEPREGEVANLQAVVFLVPVASDKTYNSLPWKSSTKGDQCLGVKVLVQAATLHARKPVTWHYGDGYERTGYRAGEAAKVIGVDVIDLTLGGQLATQGWR